MSELKATPGPWLVDDMTVYALQDSVWMGLPSKENRFFACVQGPKCPADELEANANLIAAAPEMYEALQAFIDNSSCQVNFPHECEAAEAVLQKARGEA